MSSVTSPPGREAQQQDDIEKVEKRSVIVFCQLTLWCRGGARIKIRQVNFEFDFFRLNLQRNGLSQCSLKCVLWIFGLTRSILAFTTIGPLNR